MNGLSTWTCAVNLAWLENLTKPFSSLLNPIAGRIGNWLGRRKPHLYVHFDLPLLWCIANHGPTEMMQVMFWANFNHDDPKIGLVITDAYPVGTQSQITMTKFMIPPNELVHEQITSFVLPVVAEKGRSWSCRFVLVDQFHRKYKTKKVCFQWGGPAPKPEA